MRTKTILIDVDDVTLDLVSGRWLPLYNDEWNDNLSECDIKSWDMSKYVKPECGTKIYDYLKYPSLYDNILPVVGSSLGIRTLRELDYRILFVTASTPEQSGIKYKILCNYNLVDSRKNYIEALDKSLIAGDYILDDNPDNVINAYGQGVVFTREWNKELDGYPRCNNWRDVVTYFKKVRSEEQFYG